MDDGTGASEFRDFPWHELVHTKGDCIEICNAVKLEERFICKGSVISGESSIRNEILAERLTKKSNLTFSLEEQS